MNIEKLFNVLVLGGATLGLAACNHASDEGSGGDGGAAGTSSANSGSGGPGATSGSGSAGGEASVGATSGSGGAGGEASVGATSGTGGTGGGSNLECSVPPGDPSDACGCPCCWADNCLNTEECCAGFCEAGNAGAGCCGG